MDAECLSIPADVRLSLLTGLAHATSEHGTHRDSVPHRQRLDAGAELDDRPGIFVTQDARKVIDHGLRRPRGVVASPPVAPNIGSADLGRPYSEQYLAGRRTRILDGLQVKAVGRPRLDERAHALRPCAVDGRGS